MSSSDSSLPFSCPSCQQHLTAPPELFGVSMPCPACKVTLTVPNPQLLRAVEPVVAPLPEVQAPVPDQTGSKGEGTSEATAYGLIAVPIVAAVLTFLFRADQSIPTVLTWLMVIVTAILIYADAKRVIKSVDGQPPGKLDWLVKPSPVSWALSSLVLWIVCFPAYAKYRAKYGAKNLLLPVLVGILVWIGSLLSVGVTHVLPEVDSPEVVELANRAIKESPAVRMSGLKPEDVEISNPGQISFDPEKQKRVARAQLRTPIGTEVIYYTVEWQNQGKGLIWVQIQEHP